MVGVVVAALFSFVTTASAATPLVDFQFDEGAGTTVTDRINSLSGAPGNPANPPTFIAESPSARAGDTAIHFEPGQYMVVNDPDTRMRFDPADASFTLQAWVKFATPTSRQVFFYSNGPGGAVSFSVNSDRTVFITTLGIADVPSAAAIPDDDAWHHIAVVHQAGVELRFYVDGLLGDTVAYDRGVNFTRTQTLFSIGAEWNGALQYTGSIDRLKVHSGILAPEELDSQKALPIALASFAFDEGSGTTVTDTINSLIGAPGVPANPPTFQTDSPSTQASDTSVNFEAGQYFVVNDPDTRVRFDTNDASFTVQAWVKGATPVSRQVFFYSNGPGGAVSFSINSDRTVFITTLGIADVPSAAAIPDDGEWHHIAVIHQAGVELRFYVDGALADTVPYDRGVNFTRTQTLFSIGAEWNGALQYIGSIDRLKISSGMLLPSQLDSQKIPPVGEAALTIGRPSSSPFGFSLGVTETGGSVADTNTIALSLNGATVTPTAVVRNGLTTTVGYNITGAPLPSGSTNTVTLSIKDRGGRSYTNTATFVVASYGTLTANNAVPASAVDKTKKGFLIKTYQIDGGTPEGTIAYNEALLAGDLGPNVANLEDAGGVNTNGYFTWPAVINFDTDPAAANGYFNIPDFETTTFPGIPGNAVTTSPIENFVEEIIAALEFTTPGMYSMAVNTDWTGFPNATDGYLVRAGSNPTNAASSTVLGFFDANAPSGPERGVANSPFQFYVPQPGIYPFRLMYYQSAGTANLEWYILNPDGTRTLINDPAAGAIPAYYAWTPSTGGGPTLSLARSASGITLTFTGTLESADRLSGPWSNLAGASPLSITTGAPMKFYRAKQQ